jgi:hypothetical protein
MDPDSHSYRHGDPNSDRYPSGYSNRYRHNCTDTFVNSDASDATPQPLNPYASSDQ